MKVIPLDDQLARIAAKLKAVADVPANLAIFGAQKHRFKLNPPIADSAVTAFEQAHGVRLPDAYRRFVTVLADGGAGPTYGYYRWQTPSARSATPMLATLAHLARSSRA